MKTTAKEFTHKPAEAFRRAEKGETITINHDRYPTVIFEMTARERGGSNLEGDKEDDAN